MTYADEPDAFPFKGDAVLHGIAQTSCRGHIVALSATPDDSLKEYETLTLFRRHHGHDLALPRIILLPRMLQVLYLVFWLKDKTKVMVFAPSIETAKKLAVLLRTVCFTSQSENKEEILQRFKEGSIKVLICTSILERGVTFSNVQVAVLQADHRVFDKASLIQIAGRVGRDKDYPDGEVIFLCSRKNRMAVQARNEIRQMNA